MRAIYQEDLTEQDQTCVVVGESLHHLLNVLRIKVNDEVLFLDGKGSSRKSIIKDIQKKKIKCEFLEDINFSKRENFFEVALGKTKRDALELSLKQAVEIGVKKIYIFESLYSQRYELKENRLKKLLIASIEQSNASYLPEIVSINFEDLFMLKNKKILYFSSIENKDELAVDKNKINLVVIGPEGGLSKDEELRLNKLQNCKTINLPTNIMRAPTATSYCLGYCAGILNKLD